MLDSDQLRSLPHIRPPVLTAYVDTNPATRRTQGHPPELIIGRWIGGAAASGTPPRSAW